jgi:hypothetical protein
MPVRLGRTGIFLERRSEMGLLQRLGLKPEPEKKNHLLLLVDWENVARAAAIEGKILDIEKLCEECLEVGFLEFKFIFAPDHLVSYRMPTRSIYNRGFYIITCPSKYGENELKEKDRVDTIMSEIGKKFIERSDITHIVIVTHDGDFTRLSNIAKDHRKKIIAIAGENISFLLKQVVDVVYPLPLKNKENGNGF